LALNRPISRTGLLFPEAILIAAFWPGLLHSAPLSGPVRPIQHDAPSYQGEILRKYHIVVLFPSESRVLRDRDIDTAAETLSLGATAVLYTEYLDLLRFPDVEREQTVTQYLRAKYASQHIDAVLAVGYDSLNFALRRGAEIFGSIPVTFCSVEQSRVDGLHLPPYFTGVTNTDNVRGLIDAALRLQPDTREIVIPGGSSEYDEYWLQHDRRILSEFEGRVHVRYLTGLPMLSMLRALGRLKPHTIVFVHAFYRDGSGESFSEGEMMSLISKNATAPVYAMTRPGGQKGVLAGPPGGATGLRYAVALKMIERTLAGEAPSNIPIQHLPGATVFAFDASQFSRWGIDSARVPSGSLLVNRQLTLWEQYRELVVGMAIFILLESVLIAVLLVQRQKRRRAEAMLADRNAQLQQSENSLRQLSGQLISAQEEERRRIARELHDDLNQQVADLGMSLSGIKRGVPATMDGMRGDIAGVQKRLMTLSDGLRQISHELHPGMLELFGLVPTLGAHCREFSAIASLPIEFETNCEEALPMSASLCFYRIAQEAIRNAAKHSNAGKVRVILTRSARALRLVVTDDGVGFDRDDPVRRGGLGLRSMEERVRLVGGELELISRRGSGTTLTVTVPLSETGEATQPKLMAVATN